MQEKDNGETGGTAQENPGLPVGLIIVLGMAGFVSAADNWVVSALLPAVAADFGTGIATAAGVLTAYLVPYGVMQPVYGHLADRFGKASVLRCILAGLTLATVGCVLAPALGWLMICRFVAGFFAAGIIAVSLAMIGDETVPSRRPQGVGMFMGMVFLGQGVSAGIGGFLADWLDWRMMFVCLIGVALATLWCYRRLPPGKSKSSGKPFLPEAVGVVCSERGRYIFPMAFATGFLLLGAYSYLGSCLHDQAHASYPIVGLVVMGFGIASLAAGWMLGWLSLRVQPHGLLMAGAVLAGTAAVLLACHPSVWSGVPAALLMGTGYIFLQSTLATQAFYVAEDNKGLPSALVGLGLFGGGGAGTVAGGWCLTQGGYRLLWCAAAVMLFSLALYAGTCLAGRLVSPEVQASGRAGKKTDDGVQ